MKRRHLSVGEYERLNVGSGGPKYSAVSVPTHVPVRRARRGRRIGHRLDAEHRSHRVADLDRVPERVRHAGVAAEARDVVVQPVHADFVAPTEARALEREQADARLPAVIHHTADVLRLRQVEAGRRREQHGNDGVVHLRVGTPMPRGQAGRRRSPRRTPRRTSVDFSGPSFRLPGPVRDQRRRVVVHGDRLERLEGIERSRRFAGCADRAAQLETAHLALGARRSRRDCTPRRSLDMSDNRTLIRTRCCRRRAHRPS